MLGPDGVLKDIRFILVRAEYLNVHFAAARVISTEKGSWYGVQTVERGTCSKSLMERSKGYQELGCYLAVSVMCVELIRPLSGVPCPSFYRPRGSRGYRWEKEKKTKGREGPSRVSGLPFSLSLPC